MTRTAAKRAPRLSQEARRAQILDSARTLILTRGLTSCSLEEVANAAGISKALIYRHFSSREELLQALLRREYRSLRGRGVKDVPANITFTELVRGASDRTFDYYYSQGPIVRMLLSDPSVADLLGEQDRNERHAVHRFFGEQALKTYRLPTPLAMLGAFLMLNAATNSGGALKRFGVSPKKAAEFWTTFVLAGWAAVAARYGSLGDAEEEAESKPQKKKA